MSLLHPSKLLLLATAALGSAAGYGRLPAAEDENVRFEVVSPVEVRLAGTSTLHDWDCAGDRLDLSTRMELTPRKFRSAADAAWAEGLSDPIDFKDADEVDATPLSVRIPIASLECKRSRMQRDLREAVKYEEHPVIRYELEAIQKAFLSESNPDALEMEVTGNLTVAGVGRTVEHRVRITRYGDKTFEVRGELDLKMSWFDMEPPTAFLGLLKAHDKFRVEFLFQAEVKKISTTERLR